MQETPLSDREMEILRLVATGASNKEIAIQLSISPNTVKVHLRNIFEKIEVASRTEAAAHAIRMGWVEFSDDQTPTLQLSDDEDENATPMQQFARSPGARLLLIGIAIMVGFMFVRRLMIPPAEVNNIAVTQAVSQVVSERWQVLADMPSTRSGMAALAYEDVFYLLGGESEGGLVENVWVYTPDAQVWSERASKPTPVRYAPAAILGGQIYLVGGEDQNGKPVSIVESYSPREDRWETRASLPEAMSQTALVAFEGKLYLFGGWNGMAFSSDVYVYDPSMDHWTEFSKLPSPRGFASAVNVGNKIILIGGRNNTMPINDTLAFHPQWALEGEDPWESLAPLPQGRFAMGAVELAGTIYVVGGQSYGEVQSLLTPLVYRIQDNSWQAFESPIEEVGPYLGLVADENQLHVLGGQTLTRGQTAFHQTYQAIYTRLIPLIP